MMKTCYFCRGELKKEKIRHVHRWGERIIVFDHVPAEVCQQCGEVYLSPEILEVIDRLTLEEQKPERFIRVPVFSLADKVPV